ncbi:MAG: mechanosensitive ion channel protein MscS [Rhodospirillales bacterium CG15_BIG_FIL_POST_REV_8_21_14_020_66_15]|nr:MAG: mechanosensitive ion channel protein MscS [Rhodospirillales bacterium CG15_BIG_FIL_POST_REV_8_21_14_020_66_15]
MNTYTDPEHLRQWLAAALAWIDANLLAVGNLVQLGVILATFVAARLLSPRLEAVLDLRPDVRWYARFGVPVAAALKPIARPVVWLAALWFAVFAAKGAGWPHQVMEGAVSLLTAWAVIRLASSFIRNPFWARAVAVTAWSIAALNLLGLLVPVADTLDRMALHLGDFRISVLGVVKAALVSALFLYLASVASRLAEARINASANLTPSMRVLFGKFARVSLFALAIVLALESVGIDLTAFAVFGGAVGLGIGFGLQKVVSNLMSGVILLMDRSVKPGDVIAIGDTFGWINTLGARYVSVITRDGTEHLIPNEELISQRVENWSFSNQLVRQKVPIGIDYGADVHLARELALKAAEGVDRVLKEPVPVCHLMAFGDNSVNLELRFWINDPQNGVANVRSAVQLRIWDLYHEHGVVFPFPQRDLHLRSSVPLKVEVVEPPGKGGGKD